MIHYRSFRNTDPPALVDIWRSHANVPGLAQPMSVPRLEQLVLAKPYFDHDGLIVALADEQPIGFAHAGFGPNEDETGLCVDPGVTCVLLVHPHPEHDEIERELLARCETYLTRRGAKVLYAGAIQPLTPFYLGLYGGSELPGILNSDAQSLSLYKAHDYEEIDRVCVLQCDLTCSRTVFNRRQLHLRREMRVTVTYDPPTTSWWEAVTLGDVERTRFELTRSADGILLASVNFWNMEPLASSWGIRAAGMMELDVVAEERRAGIATCLLGEAFRCLKAEGVTQVEAQTMIQNKPAQALYESFGFQQVDEGVVLRKRPQTG